MNTDSLHLILIGTSIILVLVVAIQYVSHSKFKAKTDKRLKQLVELDRLKRDFLSVAQHQLRTPLSGVKWALEMLRSDSAIPNESLSLIDSALDRVKDSISIINQMLKTVEAGEGTIMLVPEKVDLIGVVRTIIAELNFITLKKGIKLTFISPESLVINADRNKLKAALVNIIDNAIKYSPQGRVDITMSEDDKNATLEVRDNGIGIAPDDIPYAFDRLHRGKNAVMVEPDESGVGLYTSKKIIELHNGSISLTSELNKGTTVTVVVPKN
jgi:signal transduction histidine kinase